MFPWECRGASFHLEAALHGEGLGVTLNEGTGEIPWLVTTSSLLISPRQLPVPVPELLPQSPMTPRKLPHPCRLRVHPCIPPLSRFLKPQW